MFQISKRINNKAFTLIELLVVVAIIGLLATIVLVALNTARTKARNTRRNSQLQQYIRAFELAYDRDDEYPDPGGTGWYCLGDYPDGRCWQNGTSVVESAVLNGIIGGWMPVLASDNKLICGYNNVATNCYESSLYRCVTRVNNMCLTIDVRWFLEGSNQSCSPGRNTGIACLNCTYCRYP